MFVVGAGPEHYRYAYLLVIPAGRFGDRTGSVRVVSENADTARRDLPADATPEDYAAAAVEVVREGAARAQRIPRAQWDRLRKK